MTPRKQKNDVNKWVTGHAWRRASNWLPEFTITFSPSFRRHSTRTRSRSGTWPLGLFWIGAKQLLPPISRTLLLPSYRVSLAMHETCSTVGNTRRVRKSTDMEPGWMAQSARCVWRPTENRVSLISRNVTCKGGNCWLITDRATFPSFRLVRWLAWMVRSPCKLRLDCRAGRLTD